MSDELEFLNQLQNAQSEDERTWLVTKRLLDSLPDDLRQIAYAAAIPHWFDENILAVLRPEYVGKTTQLYSDLKDLSFVEPYGKRGHNVHELTRRLILEHFWLEQRAEYINISNLASKYFDEVGTRANQQAAEKLVELAKENDDEGNEKFFQWLDQNPEIAFGIDPRIQVEYIYHLLISDPEKGADAERDQGLAWHDQFDYNYTFLTALIHTVDEHINAGRVNGRGKGWKYFFEGLITSYRYLYKDAILALSEVVKVGYDDKYLNAYCIESLGDVHMQLSEYEQACACYEEALPINRAIDNKLGEANCIRALGDVHAELSEYEQARARYEEALPIHHAIDNKLGEAQCIQSLGNLHAQLSEYEQARACYEEVLPIYRAIGQKLGEANCIRDLGNVHKQLSEYEQARSLYEEALLIYRASGHKLGEAHCIKALGDVHAQLSEYEQAHACYQEALLIYRSILEKLGEANSIRALGDVHMHLSEYKQARMYYEEALLIYRSISQKLGEANSIRALGNMHMQLSEYKQARMYYEEALLIYRSIGNKLGEASCIHALGDLCVEEKNYEDANSFFERAISLYQTWTLPADEADVVNSIANMHEKQKEYTRAIETYSRALALFPDQTGYILRNRAGTYIKVKDVIKATQDVDEAAKLQPDNAYLFLRQGQLAILTEEFEESFEFFNAALERYPRMNDAFFGIGMAHLRMNHITQALKEYQQGLDVTDSPNDLEDAILELEELQGQNIPGVEDALNLLKGFVVR